jgi:prepilin-type processing-associated H-X9-DG protein
MSDREDCAERREAVAALVMGELEPQLAEELRTHLRTCETCQQVYGALAEEERLVRGAFEELARDANAVTLSLLEGAAERSARSGGRVVRALRGIVEGVRTMRIASKAVAAAAMVLLVVVLLSWRTPSGRGSGLAFGDVMDRLEKVRTVSYTLTVHSGLEGQAGGTMKVMEILGRKARIETSTGDTYIFDFEARRMVCLHQASTVMLEGEISPGARSILPGSSLEELKQKLVAKGGKEEELGEQLVEGKRATGFRIERPNGVWTVLADAETGLLVRVHHLFESPSLRNEETLSDFKFDQELDDVLFSVQPPAGYKVIEQKVLRPLLGLEPDSRSLSLCRGNLKQIGIAFFMYLQAHDHQYPNSLDELVTFLGGRQPLICPGSGEEGYVYQKPATPFLKVANPSPVMIVYDKPGNHEGGRNVVFLDGHVEWMTEEEFQKAHSDPSRH